MNLINIGCGNNFHTDWVNMDFAINSKYVIQYDITKGIPYYDNFFDVVYNSHVLEHLKKIEAFQFIKECHRVLKPGGIIRVVVPDLEVITKEYIRNLDRVLTDIPNSDFDYDWILLEMLDQITRDESGGEMAKYLLRKEIPNIEYIYSRIGDEVMNIHSEFSSSIEKPITSAITSNSLLGRNNSKFFKRIKNKLFTVLFRKEIKKLENSQKAIRLGQFRMSGENHYWMYDRYSLSKLLSNCGFIEVNIVSAFKSGIENWSSYQLDCKDGRVIKPDSLFIEARK